MSLWFTVLIFILSCIAIVKSGTWLVRSLNRIARFLKWREFTVAFILMAVATSVPELFVGISSAIQMEPKLSFGNVVGSNIINLTLVVGVITLLTGGLKLKSALAREASLYTLTLAFLPILLMLDGALSRVDGLVLLVGLAFYYTQLQEQEKRFTKEFVNQIKEDWSGFKSFLKDLGLFVGSVTVVLIAAQGVVWSASALVVSSPLSLSSIGLLIVALGTGLPELVFGLRAVALDRQELIMGGILGSVVSNSTLVLGTTVFIYPLSVIDYQPYVVGIVFTVITLAAFAVFSRTERKIGRGEALGLLVIYLVFVVVELFLI